MTINLSFLKTSYNNALNNYKLSKEQIKVWSFLNVFGIDKKITGFYGLKESLLSYM